MKKVFIATPTYEEKVSIPYVMSLLDMCEILTQNGYTHTCLINSGGSLIPMARNKIIQMFWESDADYLLCIDSDLGWEPSSIIRLLESDKDIVGGVYPTRDGTNNYVFFAVEEQDGRITQCPTTKLLEMEYIPAGFMLIKRESIQKMKEYYSELEVKNDKFMLEHDGTYHALFGTEVIDGKFYGEDILFCKRAREAGLRIWVDPFIEFNHAGYKGKLVNNLIVGR